MSWLHVAVATLLQEWLQLMDEIERAGEVGQQVAALAHGPLEPATTSCSVHVDNVANALLRSLDDARDVRGAEEEEASDSDECMETNSQRLVRYLNSRMCEVSDIDEWMELHHRMFEDEGSQDP